MFKCRKLWHHVSPITHRQAGCGELAAVHGEVPRLGDLAAAVKGAVFTTKKRHLHSEKAVQKMIFLVETCGNGHCDPFSGSILGLGLELPKIHN